MIEKSTISHNSSCMDDYNPDSLTIQVAMEQILAQINPLQNTETVMLKQALNQVLAEDIHSTIDVPGHTNSAMDGYAIRASDLPAQGTTILKLIGKAFAGHPYSGEIGTKECVRIMTGAPMPDKTDTVVIQERAVEENDIVTIDADNKAYQNVRMAGEDIAANETILQAGRRLLPSDLGLIASVGVNTLIVKSPLKVAFFSTGDELTPVGEELKTGQIYDSNRYTMFAMLKRIGAEPIDLGIVQDTRDALIQTFEQACQQADVVITSGGVSVGEADFVKDILQQLGHVHFWKVAIKPGRPLAFGEINHIPYFGLPGNPVSVMVTFYILVKPALEKMMGLNVTPHLLIKAQSTNKLRKRSGRIEYQRGILESDDYGEYQVRKTGNQGSGILSSMSVANCLIELPMETTDIAAGDIVNVIPFDSLV